jgi:hypothetical protein
LIRGVSIAVLPFANLGEGGEDGRGAGWPVGRVLREKRDDQAVQIRGELGIALPGRYRRHCQVLVHEGGRRGAVERVAAGRHLVQDAADRVQVNAGRDWLARQHLRCHVRGRAEDISRPRERRHGVEVPDNAKVEDLKLVAGLQEQVRGLEVAVDDPHAVGGREGVGELDPEVEHTSYRQAVAMLREECAQILAAQQLHDDEQPFLVAADVVHHNEP